MEKYWVGLVKEEVPPLLKLQADDASVSNWAVELLVKFTAAESHPGVVCAVNPAEAPITRIVSDILDKVTLQPAESRIITFGR